MPKTSLAGRTLKNMRNISQFSRLIYITGSRYFHFSPLFRYSLNMDEYPRTFRVLSFPSKFLSELRDIHAENGTRKLSVSGGLCAKEKNRGGKKKIGVARVDLQEMNLYLNVQKLTSKMANALEAMKNDFIKNVTIRSSTGSIEEVAVAFEDKEYCLQELVQVARKPNHVILNASAFPHAIPEILEALSKSGMNLNPQQDGTKIAIPIPKVTKEHRENLSKNAKAIFIKCRDNLKDIQNEQLKNLKNNSEINEDTFYRLKAQVEGLCHQHVQEAEKILKSKQFELLGH